MNKQELARNRNWFKLRLLGFAGFNIRSLTNYELEELNKARVHIDNIVLNFDKSNELLGIKKSNKTRCCKCYNFRVCEEVEDSYFLCKNCK